jgi:serine/threonine protein kinase
MPTLVVVESDEDESIRKTTLREVKILRLLRHKNIVSLIEGTTCLQYIN